MKTVIKTPKANQPNKPSLWVWIVKEKGFEPTYIEDINMALEFALDTKKRTINQNQNGK